ncbi:hypothetical protein PENSPDRAFT_149859 [Peniophora sp. CONT]|nr:hypothetical protein PENSPDRAFT_149859 [Peniophora sp. CONT]
MASAKSKSHRKPTMSPPTQRPALEEEDWDTKRMRIIREHFANSDGNSITSEDDRREDEDCERAQLDQGRHEADPAAAVQRWRELWEQRVPGGSNKELEELGGSFQFYADVLEEYSGQSNLEAEGTMGDLFRLWKRLYDSGLPAVCTMIARDAGLFNETEEIVNAVIAVSCGIITWGGSIVPIDFEDWSTVNGALELVRAICPNVWAHKDMLLGGGPTFGDQNRLRVDVAKFLHELALVPDSRESEENIPGSDCKERRELLADILVVKCETRSLALWCWVHGGPASDLNRAFFGREDHAIPPGLSDQLLSEVVDSFDYDLNDPDGQALQVIAELTTFIEDEILGRYGASRFFTRINDSLRESRLGRALMSLLASIGELANHPMLQPHLMDQGTFLAIRDAVDREALQGEDEYDHYIVLREALWTYRTAFAAQAVAEIAHVVRECNVIQLIARYVRLYALLGHAQTILEGRGDDDISRPSYTVKVYTSFAEVVNLRSGKNTLRKAMRYSLRQEWYSTLHVLRTEQRDSAHWQGPYRSLIGDLEQVWVALGQSVSLDEDAERRDFEREAKKASRFCSWRACQYHTETPSAPLQTCKGCGQVMYCSRACQKLDWKEGRHKVRCGNRLTEG